MSAYAQSEKPETGFYETIQDFKNNKLKDVGEFGASDMNKVIFSKDGKKTVYASRDIKEWGFKDARGIVWRVYNKQNYGIIEQGKIVVYARSFITVNKKGETEFDAEQAFFSLGYDGELFPFHKSKTLKQVGDWMKLDNAEMADKLENDSYPFFPKNLNKIIGHIEEYNHSKKSE